MNLDLGQVQAFITTADCLHFGRAAARLHLTQQGLSHRISRLEQVLGEPLLLRGHGSVELTPAGHRFLPRARELVATARLAVAEVREQSRPLRVDVWGQPHAPLRWIRKLNTPQACLHVEVSMRRSTAAAVDALLRDEIDVAFGVLPPGDLPGVLDHRRVCLDPLGVAVGPGHPLAGAPVIRAAELAPYGLWCASQGTATEVLDLTRRFTREFAIPLHETGINLGLEQLMADLVHRPSQATMVPTALPIPPDSPVTLIAITDPIPMVPWSMIWRRGDDDESLARLQHGLAQLGAVENWPARDPAHHWLPAR